MAPFSLGPLTLKNRIVSLPVFSGYALPDGRVSSLLIERYAKLAASGVAMVVVANAAVSVDGVTSAYNLRADREDYAHGLSRLARAIKQAGALACLQLNHAGRLAKTERPLIPAALDGGRASTDLASMKNFMEFFPLERRFGLTRDLLSRISRWRVMEPADQERVARDFARAAGLAARTGFDLVELHGASGYLLSQFLSGQTNSKPDLAARAAFPLLVLERVRQALPSGFPVGWRLMLREWVEGGIDLRDALAWAGMLQDQGIAYLSATAGAHTSLFSPQVRRLTARPGYLAQDAAALKKAVRTPVVIAGRILIREQAEQLLIQGSADLIGLGRTLLADGDWLAKSRRGRKPRACVDCYACFKRVVLEQALACVRWPHWRMARVDLEHKLLTRGMYKGLLAAVDQRDLELYQRQLPTIMPRRHGLSATMLFLQKGPGPARYGPEEKEFAGWLRSQWEERGFRGGRLDFALRRTPGGFEHQVRAEAEEGGYGLIMVCRRPGQAWRTRVLYQARGRTAGMLGAHPNQLKVLVPLDLSEISLLVMHLVRHAILCQPEAQARVVHVLDGPREQALATWREYCRILEWDPALDLEILPPQKDVARALLALIREGDHGRVVMGQRGMAGIKRWLLGSVSAGVLRGLDDQSLFLVD